MNQPHAWHRGEDAVEPIKDAQEFHHQDDGTIDDCGYTTYYKGCSTFFKKNGMIVEVQQDGTTITNYGNYTIKTTPALGYTTIEYDTLKFTQLTNYENAYRNRVIAKHGFFNKTEADAKFIDKQELIAGLATIFIIDSLIIIMPLLFKYANEIRTAVGSFLTRKVKFDSRVKVVEYGKPLKIDIKQIANEVWIEGTYPKGKTGLTPKDCNQQRYERDIRQRERFGI